MSNNIEIFNFSTSSLAWKFVKEMESEGRITGYPSLVPNKIDSYYTVQVDKKDSKAALRLWGTVGSG